MARFALLLPREEMVEPAGRIARELEMDVVLNQSVPTERILDLMEDCRRTGADILVARGRQASILKEHTDFPVVEIQLTGLEIARLLHRARSLVSHLERPKIGVVTIPNMVGNIQGFEEIFDIELHTYFISGLSEMERGAEQAVADGMDVILGLLPPAGQAHPLFRRDGGLPAHQPAPRPQRGAGRRRRAPQHGPSASSAGLLLQRDSGAGRPGNHRPEQRRGL